QRRRRCTRNLSRARGRGRAVSCGTSEESAERRRSMSRYAVAKLEEIEEIDDGRVPFRPVRHHLGIEAFGVNTWTAHKTGDRIVNEHDEAGSGDSQEELYFVYS